jgi:methionine-rich copper-binding protein CopC
VLTLFDSGGNDTLDFSGWSDPSRIDLVPGAYSSGNEMTNNVAIAYSTTIENAIGGGGNDVIAGNDAANVLEGGAGGDELQGLGGNDTLTGGTGNDIIDGGTGDDTAVFDGVFALFTVSAAGNVVTLTSTGTGTDRVSGVERFRFTDGTRTLTDLSPTADITAPLLSGLSPSDNSANLSVGTSFVLTFNENVKAGGGSLHIWLADGSLWRSVAVGNTTQVRFSGNSVTLDPSANLPANGGYYITVDAGAISDAAGNDYAGFSGAGQWNFSTSAADTHAPQVIDLTPADEGTGASTRADLVIEFDEAVSAGSGNIVIQKGVTAFATIAVTDTSRVRINGSTVTVNPSADFEQGAAYNVTLDRGTFKDASGNAFAGATAANWNFVTASAPQGDDYPLGPDTQGQLASTGTVLSARIDGPSDGDMFRVTLTAGVTYRFDMMSSSGIDPYLVLYGQAPGYELVAFDDDGGPLGPGRAAVLHGHRRRRVLPGRLRQHRHLRRVRHRRRLAQRRLPGVDGDHRQGAHRWRDQLRQHHGADRQRHVRRRAHRRNAGDVRSAQRRPGQPVPAPVRHPGQAAGRRRQHRRRQGRPGHVRRAGHGHLLRGRRRLRHRHGGLPPHRRAAQRGAGRQPATTP